MTATAGTPPPRPRAAAGPQPGHPRAGCSTPRSSAWPNSAGRPARSRSSPSAPGVSRGAAQHHFPTREALFTAALEHVGQARGAELRHELAGRPADTADARRGDLRAVQRDVLPGRAGAVGRGGRRAAAARAGDPASRPDSAARSTASAVELLGVDESVPGVRETVQATLDLARGLGLANLLTDDSRRRKAHRPRVGPHPRRPTAPAGLVALLVVVRVDSGPFQHQACSTRNTETTSSGC